MYGQGSTKTANFICGLGGRDVSKDMIAEMFGVLQNLSDGKFEDEVQFIGKRW
jgi:pyruvate ferredoxin oxidoreductase alpha subunit